MKKSNKKNNKKQISPEDQQFFSIMGKTADEIVETYRKGRYTGRKKLSEIPGYNHYDSYCRPAHRDVWYSD